MYFLKQLLFVFCALFILVGEAWAGGAKTVWVNSYTRKDGTYVSGHWRSPPGSSFGLSPSLGSSVSAGTGICYIPDYSMNDTGTRKSSILGTVTKEGLDLSKCVVGSNGGAGVCEGFKIAVTSGKTYMWERDHFDSLAQHCRPSGITNLPGRASVVCNGEGAQGSSSWTLSITPEPVCVDPADEQSASKVNSSSPASAKENLYPIGFVVNCKAVSDRLPNATTLDESSNYLCPARIEHNREPWIVAAESNGWVLTLKIDADNSQIAWMPGYDPVKVKFVASP